LEVPVAEAFPPAPPLPAVVVPVVVLSPEVAVDELVGSTVTPPELPVLPELPDVALDETVAAPELPVLPVSPELPEAAASLMMQLNTPPVTGASNVKQTALFVASPVLPELPEAPVLPDVAVPPDDASPVGPELPVVPDIAVVVFCDVELAVPLFPPVTLPVELELPPVPDVTSPVVELRASPVVPDVAIAEALPLSPV
jgi:hypothetical protein